MASVQELTPLPQNKSGEIQTDLSPEVNKWLEEQSTRYLSDSVCIPVALAQRGIELDLWAITPALNGDGLVSDHGTGGLARASIEIGRFINKLDKPIHAFNYDKLPRKEVKVYDEDYGKEFIDQEIQLPPEEDLRAAADPHQVGEAGALFLNMVADMAYPYEPTEGDGYVKLEPRDPKNAYETGRYGISNGDNAKHCSDTEEHFSYNLDSGSTRTLKELKIDDQVVALQKFDGNHTAILTRPAVLNGVRIPAGSVMTVEGNEKDGYRFGFGRLTLFSVNTVDEAKRQFPKLFNEEFKDEVGINKLRRAFATFNKLAGRHVTDSDQLLDDYFKDNPQSSYSEACEKLCAEIDNKLSDDEQIRHILQGLNTIKKRSHDAAQAAYDDKEVEKASDYRTTPKSRLAVVKKIANLRRHLYRTYGPQAVRTIEDLLDIRTTLQARIEK
jgi:hypothetical protein